MRNFTLISLLLLFAATTSAQDNPCPNIVNYGYQVISSNGVTCTAKIYVTANGVGVSSDKGLRVEVFTNSIGPVNLISEGCFVVPGAGANTVYETPSFTISCATPIVYQISRRTASNGSCQGGLCNGSTVITVNAGPLPITIASFYAKRSGANVLLNWRTGSESNAKEMIVERNNGAGFVKVGTVAATNNPTGNDYTFTDNNPVKGISEYRLKLVDKDGASKYSDIKAVRGTAAVSDFTIFPNPSVGTTKITVSDISEPTTIQVIDNSGKLIKTIAMTSSNTVQLTGLQRGIYLVRISNNNTGEAVTKKLTVVQ